MLNTYTLNIQESLKHAWHWGIGFLRCLAAKVLMHIALWTGKFLICLFALLLYVPRKQL